jgi:hypothetical protein
MPIECNCEKGGVCQIHPKQAKTGHVADAENPRYFNQALVDKATVAEEISPEDKLQLKILEAKSLNAQLNVQQAANLARQEAINASQQLDMFASAMFTKFGLTKEHWILDLVTLKFTPRPKP